MRYVNSQCDWENLCFQKNSLIKQENKLWGVDYAVLILLAVLIRRVVVGIVQHARKKSADALNTLETALSLEPRSPLCKFHKASILFANDRHQEALNELLELKKIVPKESLVYFLIGKVGGFSYRFHDLI